MKKRFNLFLMGAALVAALIGMVSCQKDWQKDIDDLGRQINDLSTQLTTLQTQISNGEIVTNVTPIQGGIKVTTNKASYDIVGQKGEGSVVKIGDDGYWYIDNKKTDYKAQGAAGQNGDYYVPGANGKFDKYTWNADKGAYDKTATDISYIAPGAVTAVWADDALTLYGVEGYDGGYTLELLTGLKGLAFVPERIFDGLGLITVYEFTAPANNKEFPFVNKEGDATFIATAPTEVTYRMDAANIDVAKYTWDFINREVYTKAADPDNTDLVKIEEGPIKDDSFVSFKIQLLKSVEPADHEKTNDIVALRAVGDDSEPVVSDYAYIEKETNSGYDLIHKDEYEETGPRYYRTDPVAIDDDTDYNDGEGIEVSGNLNPATPVLVIDEKESVNLLDYVETYAEQLEDLVSTAGVDPTYKFYFAGFDDSGKVIISTDSKKATYLSDDDDKTNQNQFIKFVDDSTVEIDRDFVSAGRPAIGRTPLIYVQSIYNGVILAEGFIKLVIVEEEEGPQPPKPTLGYKVFIKHGGEFDYDSIPEEGTYVGSAFTDPNTALNYDGDNHELNVAWDEMNVKMFNELGMSFEEFQNAYNVDEPILIVKDANNGEPGDLPDEGKYEFSADLGELNNIYSDGLTITKLSPANWKQNTNIVDLKLDPEVEISGSHFVYVVYTAKDNTENVDAVVKFVYNVKHDHTYSVSTWLLNPDYILGNQDELNPVDPVDFYNKPATPYNKDKYGWGAVRIKGQEEAMRSGLTEHFLEYMTPFKNDINDESIFKFEIKNYATDEVDWEECDYRDETTYEDGTVHAYVQMTGAELKEIIENPELVPYIYLNTDNALIAKGYDVLVEVEENCEKLDEAEYGYYFVVFKALDAHLKLFNVKLGTFKEVNDYVYAHELVDGIFDAYNNKIFEWSDSAWVATEAAAVYGITGTEDLTVEVKSVLNYKYDSEESFGGNLYPFEKGASLIPAPSETTETGINWWNLGTDLQVDKKAEFTIVVKWGEDVLVEDNGTVLVLATANSIHALHDANDAVLDPVEYKDGWYYAVEAEAVVE